MEEQVQIRGGDTRGQRKKGKVVIKEVWDKGKVDGTYQKCGRSNN